MLYISHRGNLDGMEPEKENSPEYVQAVLDKNYHVLVDTWLVGSSSLALGTRYPQYPVSLEFMKAKGIIARAATVETLEFLMSNNIHCFLASHDEYTLTNGGLIWTRHGKKITGVQRCVIDMPEWYIPSFEKLAQTNAAGVCSDCIEEIKEVCDQSRT
jgi:hypothetical protein